MSTTDQSFANEVKQNSLKKCIKLFGIDFRKKYRTLAEIKILLPKQKSDKFRNTFLQ